VRRRRRVPRCVCVPARSLLPGGKLGSVMSDRCCRRRPDAIVHGEHRMRWRTRVPRGNLLRLDRWSRVSTGRRRLAVCVGPRVLAHARDGGCVRSQQRHGSRRGISAGVLQWLVRSGSTGLVRATRRVHSTERNGGIVFPTVHAEPRLPTRWTRVSLSRRRHQQHADREHLLARLQRGSRLYQRPNVLSAGARLSAHVLATNGPALPERNAVQPRRWCLPDHLRARLPDRVPLRDGGVPPLSADRGTLAA